MEWCERRKTSAQAVRFEGRNSQPGPSKNEAEVLPTHSIVPHMYICIFFFRNHGLAAWCHCQHWSEELLGDLWSKRSVARRRSLPQPCHSLSVSTWHKTRGLPHAPSRFPRTTGFDMSMQGMSRIFNRRPKRDKNFLENFMLLALLQNHLFRILNKTICKNKEKNFHAPWNASIKKIKLGESTNEPTGELRQVHLH